MHREMLNVETDARKQGNRLTMKTKISLQDKMKDG